jgi:hypothetical protein
MVRCDPDADEPAGGRAATPDITALAEEAEDAFWEVIAGHFPEATSGDLSPLTSHAFSGTAERAVREWIGANAR